MAIGYWALALLALLANGYRPLAIGYCVYMTSFGFMLGVIKGGAQAHQLLYIYIYIYICFLRYLAWWIQIFCGIVHTKASIDLSRTTDPRSNFILSPTKSARTCRAHDVACAACASVIEGHFI